MPVVAGLADMGYSGLALTPEYGARNRFVTIITDEERLYELVPRLLIDFKLSIVEEEMKHTLQALANPDIYNNPEKCQEIMQHYKELQKIQIPMAQKADDHVILR